MATFQRTLSLQVASQNAPSGYVKQWVSAYNLKWADLRKWLVETRFKNAPELDSVLVQDMDCLQDYFYFHVPEVLTAADADAINSSLRKTDASTTDRRIHRGRTPDPDPED